jgi:MFS family permease
VGQVTGRVFFAPLARRTSPAGRACGVIVLGSLGVLALAVLPGPIGLLLAVAVVAGAGRGMHTLLQASAVSDRWGTRAFGRINGVLSAPMTLGVALAPAGGVVVAGLVGGYPAAFAVLGGVALVCGLVALLT